MQISKLRGINGACSSNSHPGAKPYQPFAGLQNFRRDPHLGVELYFLSDWQNIEVR
jgi:hypothetical protein